MISLFFLQIQSLENEKKRLQSDLELACKQHKEETEIQQLQNFQVKVAYGKYVLTTAYAIGRCIAFIECSCFSQTFRNYRSVFEEQKTAIEQRYRSLLEEAIQDAVFLSATNQELMFENQQIKQGCILSNAVEFFTVSSS